jgi:predicted SnoaL-like aldol condensation-catalyzing enzyme
MRVLARSRLVATAAVSAAVLGFGVAYADGGDGHRHPSAGKHPRGCQVNKHQLERNKRTVVAFYTTAFNDAQPRLAVKRYVGPVYIQHNPLAADGAEAFIAFVEDFTSANLQLNVDIKRVIAECDLVVTHSHLTLSPTDRGNAVMDIFRLNERGKVVEHWDVIQPVPANPANDNTMF